MTKKICKCERHCDHSLLKETSNNHENMGCFVKNNWELKNALELETINYKLILIKEMLETHKGFKELPFVTDSINFIG